MASHLRAVRRVVGIVLLAGIGAVGFLLVRMQALPTGQETETRVAPPESLPVKPEGETACFDDFVLDWAGDRLEAGRACRQPDGSTALEGGLLLHVKRDDGTAEMEIRASRGDFPADEKQPFTISGAVRMETPARLVLEGERLTIDKPRKVLSSQEPVTFRQDDVTGKAGALEHRWEAQHTVLRGSPEVILEGERTKSRRIVLTGDEIERLEGGQRIRATSSGTSGATLDFGDGRIAGSDVLIELAPETQQVRSIVADGGATTTVRMLESSGLTFERVLVGSKVTHGFDGAGQLSRVEATGAASMEGGVAGAAPDALPHESLAGDVIDLDLAGVVGESVLVDSIAARGAPARFSRREVTAVREATGFDLFLDIEGQRVSRLEVKGSAAIRDESGGVVRTLSGDTAELKLDPTGTWLSTLAFTGTPGKLAQSGGKAGPNSAPRTMVAGAGVLELNAAGIATGGLLERDVEVIDAGVIARADRAEILDDPPRTVLTGHASVERDRRRSHGDRIVRETETLVTTVEGSQHTVIRDASTLPGMQGGAESAEPVYISADKLVLDERARRATYTGGRPALRRGDTELVADTIVLDDAGGKLDADGDVRSRLRLAKPGGRAPDPEGLFDPARLVEGQSDEFHYGRADSRVTYQGAVRLEQEKTVLTGDTATIHLDPEASRVRELVATGSALFESPVRGQAEGARIEYRASDGRIRVEGGLRPARAKEPGGSWTTGDILEMKPPGGLTVVSSSGRTRGGAPTAAGPTP